MDAAWLTAFTALAAAIGGLLAWGGRLAWRLITRTLNFLDDWAGEPARPGVEARPGVMARLLAMERKLAEVQAETKPNGGHSLRDVVHRTANDVTEVKHQVATLAGEVAQIKRRGNHA